MKCEHCSQEMRFWVTEMYLAEDGVGAVERMEAVCTDHAKEAEPVGLDQAYANYEFRIHPDEEAFGMFSVSDGDE